MNIEQKNLLLATIHSQPNQVSSDYAAIVNISTRAVNLFLQHDPDGQNAVMDGKIAVLEREPLPAWAVENGLKKVHLKYGDRSIRKSRALVVVPPPPELSGVREYDRMSVKVNDLDREIGNTSSVKRKNELLLKRAELLENQSLMMSFMREHTRALQDANAAHRQTIDVMREREPSPEVKHPNGYASDRR